MSCVEQQKLSEDNVVRPRQLNSNCKLVCVKSKVTVFVRFKFLSMDNNNNDNDNNNNAKGMAITL